MTTWIREQQLLIHYAVLLLIVVVGVGLRLEYLGRIAHLDESETYMRYVSGDLWNVISNYRNINNHVFHNLLVFISTSIFGNNLFGLRLPAFLSGVLMIPAVYWATRAFYDALSGLLAAALTAMSEALVDWSVNARGYTLQALIFVVLLIVAHAIKNGKNELRWWLALSVLSALGFLTLPTMVYPMGMVALWLLASILFETQGRERVNLLRNFALAMALGALLTLLFYTPIFVETGFSTVMDRWIGFKSDGVVSSSGSNLVDRFWTFDGPDTDYFGYLSLLGIVSGLLLHRAITRDRVPLLLASAAWMLGISLVTGRVGAARGFLYLIPLYFIVGAPGIIGLVNLLRKAIKLPDVTFAIGVAGAVVVLVVVLMFTLLPRYELELSSRSRHTPGSEAMAQYVAENTRAGDPILGRSQALWSMLYYLTRYEHDAQYIITNGPRKSAIAEGAETDHVYFMVRSYLPRGAENQVDRWTNRFSEVTAMIPVQTYEYLHLYEIEFEE